MVSRRNFIRGLGGLVLASQIPTKLIFDLGYKSHKAPIVGWDDMSLVFKREFNAYQDAVYEAHYSYWGMRVLVDSKLPPNQIYLIST